MGESQEPEINISPCRQGSGIGIAKFQLIRRRIAQSRDERRDRLTRVLTRSNCRQFDLRMSEEQLNQNFAGITRRTNDADIHLSKWEIMKT